MIRILRTLDELKVQSQQWNALPGAKLNPLLSFEWISAAAESCRSDGELYIVTVWNHDRLRAVAPLHLRRIRGALRLEFLGYSLLYEPCGFLFDGDDSLEELCSALSELSHSMMLRRISDPANLEQKLKKSALYRGTVRTGELSSSPYIPIQSDWDSYFKSLSSRRRYDFRHVRARLCEQGPVSADIISPTGDQLHTLLNDAVRIESSGWKGRRGSGLAVNEPLRRFFTAYAEQTSRTGSLRLCFLRIGDRPIAMQIAVLHANSWWVLKIGYDEAWAGFSPGMQLIMETVRHAFEKKLDTFEFLGTSQPWLRIWSREVQHYAALDYYPRNISGLTARSLDAAFRFARNTFIRNK